MKNPGNTKVQGWGKLEPAYADAEWKVRQALAKAAGHVPRMLTVVPMGPGSSTPRQTPKGREDTYAETGTPVFVAADSPNAHTSPISTP